jgi:hypothetical protein
MFVGEGPDEMPGWISKHEIAQLSGVARCPPAIRMNFVPFF